MINLRGAWRLAALLALMTGGLLFVAACGDDDDGDTRVGRIGGVSELATYAYAGAGAEGFYDYLSSNVTDVCTKEQVTAALASHEQPTGWQQMKDVTFQNDHAATATVILIYSSSEREEEEWTFVREGNVWRIDNVPGLETCESAG